jgi:hypothetical protein
MNGPRHAPIIKDENVLLTLGPPASGIEDYRRSAVISSFTLSITACIPPLSRRIARAQAQEVHGIAGGTGVGDGVVERTLRHLTGLARSPCST